MHCIYDIAWTHLGDDGCHSGISLISPQCMNRIELYILLKHVISPAKYGQGSGPCPSLISTYQMIIHSFKCSSERIGVEERSTRHVNHRVTPLFSVLCVYIEGSIYKCFCVFLSTGMSAFLAVEKGFFLTKLLWTLCFRYILFKIKKYYLLSSRNEQAYRQRTWAL